MVYNPYAKKRPRPPEWASSSTASSSDGANKWSSAVSNGDVNSQRREQQTPQQSQQGSDFHRPSTSSNVVPSGPQRQQLILTNSYTNSAAIASGGTVAASGGNCGPDQPMHVVTVEAASRPSAPSAATMTTATDASRTTSVSTSGGPLCSVPPFGKPSPNPYLKREQAARFRCRNADMPAKSTSTPVATAATAATTTSLVGEGSLTVATVPQYPIETVTAAKEAERNGSGSATLQSRNINGTSMMVTQTFGASGGGVSRGGSSQTVGRAATTMPCVIVPPRPASWNAAASVSIRRMAGEKNAVARPTGANPDSNSQSSQQRALLHQPQDYELPEELAYSADVVKPIQDEFRMSLIKNAKLQEPLKNGWTLYPHQRKAIIRSLTMRRMILALDMGLGKTIIGAVWAKAFQRTFANLKVFVICPVSLQEEWKRTAEDKAGLAVEQETCTAAASKGKNKKAKPKLSRKTRQAERDGDEEEHLGADGDDEGDDLIADGFGVKISSWSKIPTMVESNVEHFVVVCDEAHSMQSIQAARTKDVLTLTDDRRCVGLLLLTGTPMKNGKPSNLFPLLKAVRHPLGRHQKAFETHFCNGMLKNFGKGCVWDASGCSNLAQLKQLVASNLLHMTKEQCLNDLPPMTNIQHNVPVSSRFQIQYERCVKDLANVQANAKDLNDEAILGTVQRLRVICAFAKVEATVELARRILNDEPAVVIFSSFAQVAKDVHAKLSESGWPCALLTGETPQKKRQLLVDNFQNGLSSVFVCTFGAGGVGLTLTAAATIILLDRPWTPGETRQAEDRIRRIGQEKDCKSYWMRSFDLDKQIDDMLESKKQTTNAVLNRNEVTAALAAPAAKISINKLVRSFLLSAPRKQL